MIFYSYVKLPEGIIVVSTYIKWSLGKNPVTGSVDSQKSRKMDQT